LKQLISSLPQHLGHALSLGQNTSLKPSPKAIQQVLILGLGGSGIGGSILADLMAGTCPVSVSVTKNYSIPAFVGPHTLVLVCSYSGNTEETLSALRQAQQKGAQIACISSGGKVKAIAEKEGYNCLSMPGGNPPRSMFGYSFAFLLQYFNFYGLTDVDYTAELTAAASLLETTQNALQAEAQKLAENLKDTTVQILAVDGTGGVAARWRQQLNENAKMLCWQAVIPEMNHNELVGWEGGSEKFSALFLRHASDYERNQKRIEICKEIIGQKTPHVYEVWSKGDSAIQRALYLIHLGDWVSFYLAELNQVDIIDIKSIDLLKSELSKIEM
jgi:glucose/mannose-6-phosphate isomerase